MKVKISYRYKPDGTPYCYWADATIYGQYETAVDDSFEGARTRLLHKLSQYRRPEEVHIPEPEEVDIPEQTSINVQPFIELAAELKQQAESEATHVS